MDLVEEVKKIAKGLDMFFMFNDWSRANVDLDSMISAAFNRNEYPLCLFVMPIGGEMNIDKGGRFKSSYDCLICFLDKSNIDENSTASFETVQKMNTYARKFISAVNASKVFDYVDGTLKIDIPYNKMDVNMTGVCVNITLTEKMPACV